jgi:hypothetical protein
MRGDEDDAQLRVFVQSMQEMFGDRALAIASRQFELADATSAATWKVVVDRLRRHEDRASRSAGPEAEPSGGRIIAPDPTPDGR